MEPALEKPLTPPDDVWRPLKRLRMSWLSSLEVLFNPLSVIWIGLTVGLILYQTYTRVDLQGFPALGVLITTGISLASGLAGIFLEKRWSRISEGGILVTRGKSAIRGLTLLLQNLNALERRVAIYLARAQGDNVDKSITSSYEEVIDRCTALQEEAVNSIEEWQDIIPDANVKGQIGLITALKRDTAQYNVRVGELQSQLDESKSGSKEVQDALQKQLSEIRGKLKATTDQLREAESKLASSPLSGLSGFQSTGVSSFVSPGSLLFPKVNLGSLGIWACPKCGEVQVGSKGPTCPRCDKKTEPPRTGRKDEPQQDK